MSTSQGKGTKSSMGDFKPNGELIMIHSVDDIFENLQNSSFEGAAFYSDFYLNMYNYGKPVDQKLYFHQLNQTFLNFNMEIRLTSQRNYLVTTIKKKVNLLVQGGFFNHWLDHYLKDRSLVEKNTKEEKIVLTMDHLSAGFILCLAVLTLALGAFIAEHIQLCVTKLLSRIF